MSTNKTPNMKMHEWVGNDYLQRQEFVDNFRSLDTELADREINVKWFGAKGDGVTNDTVAIQNAINATPLGQTLYFPKGTYIINSVIEVTKKIKLNGVKPFWNGSSLTNGTILKGSGILIKSGDGHIISGIGIQTPTTANGFEILGMVSDVTFNECVSNARDHCYLVQSYEGLVKNIKFNKCQAHGAIHGFISKAESVQFTDCLVTNCTTNGFGIISDNILAANKLGIAYANKVVNCEAQNCQTGLTFYARDMFSNVNANNISDENHTVTNFIAKDCLLGIRVGDAVFSDASKIYLAPKKIIFTGISHKNSSGFSFEINQSEDVVISGVTSNRGMNISKANSKNLRINNSLSNLSKQTDFTDITFLPSGTTPSVATSGGIFQTNSNGVITNLLDGREDKVITLLFKDDATTIYNGGNFSLNYQLYQGKGSYIVLKYQDGKWWEITGNRNAIGTRQRSLAVDATPLNLREANTWDIFGNTTTTNKIDFAEKNPNSEIITLIIRSSGGTFTFGGFSTNFSVPAGFPTSVSFGTASVSQWTYFNATGKWICVSQTTAPY